MNEYMKRCIDIVLSLLALLVLSPLLIPVAVVLKLTGEHYVFYTQQRIGRGGRPFGFLKFATMLKDSPNMGTGDITLPNDCRVLPFGRLLRKTKINELPQLINVLKGDMSLIGPRPLTPKHFNYYSAETKAAISQMRPGLSGAGSLVFRSEEDVMAASDMPPQEFYTHQIAPYKGTLEIWYAEHQSLWLDLRLILLTAWAVLFPKSQWCLKLLKGVPRPNSMLLAECLGMSSTDEDEVTIGTVDGSALQA